MNVVEVYLPVFYESSVISRDHPLPIMTPINGPHGTVVSLREGERERLGAKGEKEKGGGEEGKRGRGGREMRERGTREKIKKKEKERRMR